jgi:D-inositol-3-phosphate glycosyltransferase
MFLPNQHPIALISVHGDPAIDIGKEEAGGQNVYVRQVGEALARLGWDVTLFTRRIDPQQPEVVEHHPQCRTVRLTAGPQDFVPRDHLFDYLPAFVQAFLQYQQEQGVAYQIVHTNYWLSSWVGMELRQYQPLHQVHTYHSLGAVKYQAVDQIPAIAETRLAIEKRCLETVSCVVATSPQEEEHLRSFVSAKGTVTIIPCGTDIHRFGHVSRAAAREKLGLNQEDRIVFYVGRFDPRKGIETLVRAVGESPIREIPNVHLVIGGGSRPGRSDGLERERIEGIVSALGIESITTFTGRISDDDLPFYYAAADVCVVPSHYEPFGLVAIEAMASCTPVVASDVGGLQFTVVPHETGLLAQPKDVAGFAEAIAQILNDSDYAQKLGSAARQRIVEKFSWDGVAGQLSQLYGNLLSETPTMTTQQTASLQQLSA